MITADDSQPSELQSLCRYYLTPIPAFPLRGGRGSKMQTNFSAQRGKGRKMQTSLSAQRGKGQYLNEIKYAVM